MGIVHTILAIAWIGLFYAALRDLKGAPLLPRKATYGGLWAVALLILATGLLATRATFDPGSALFTTVHGWLVLFKGLVWSLLLSVLTLLTLVLLPRANPDFAKNHDPAPFRDAARRFLMAGIGLTVGAFVLSLLA